MKINIYLNKSEEEPK